MSKVSQDPRAVAERLRVALDLMEAGMELMRQKMRREHPEISADELDTLMRGWLCGRPADAPGRLVDWPRSAKGGARGLVRDWFLAGPK